MNAEEHLVRDPSKQVITRSVELSVSTNEGDNAGVDTKRAKTPSSVETGVRIFQGHEICIVAGTIHVTTVSAEAIYAHTLHESSISGDMSADSCSRPGANECYVLEYKLGAVDDVDSIRTSVSDGYTRVSSRRTDIARSAAFNYRRLYGTSHIDGVTRTSECPCSDIKK